MQAIHQKGKGLWCCHADVVGYGEEQAEGDDHAQLEEPQASTVARSLSSFCAHAMFPFKFPYIYFQIPTLCALKLRIICHFLD